ncbi:MAG: glycosyltransferase family 4 protein [Verrucomicrobiota bacterium]
MRLAVFSPLIRQGEGGVQAYGLHLVTALRQNAKIESVALLEIDLPKTPVVRLIPKFIFLFKALISIVRGTDLVWVTHIDLAPVAYLFTKIGGPPYILSCHGLEVWRDLPPIKQKALQAAKRLLPVSHYTMQQLIHHYGIAEEQCVLFPNTYESRSALSDRCRSRNQIAQEWNIPESDLILFSLSRLRPEDREKGYGQTLRVTAALNEKGLSCTYIAAGSGSDIQWLQSLAGELRIADKLKCPGFVTNDQLPRYYQAADLFIMPSLKEGFGIVFLEALDAGLPVLAGDQDGSSEPLLNGELGFLCDPHDVQEMVQTVKDFFANKSHPFHQPEFLRSRVNEAFGQQAYMKRLEDFLSQ